MRRWIPVGLLAFLVSGAPSSMEWAQDRMFTTALLRLSGSTARADDWLAWWRANAAKFPAQLDPDAIPVGPLEVR